MKNKILAGSINNKIIKDYYKNFERGVRTKNKELGDIILPSDAMNETVIQSPKNAKEVLDLSKEISEAKYIGSEVPEHIHSKYKIIKFHRLSGEKKDYLIAENDKGKLYFYKIVNKKISNSGK